MAKKFNYEESFMGVFNSKQDSYLRTFSDDYRLKRLTEVIESSQKGNMLDIGCGGGITTESLSYYFPKAKFFGCDVSKEAISYAKKFGSGKVTYSVIRGKKLPYKNNTFTVCVCLDVMEHVPDIDFFLEEVKRILKKNGKFFLLVPTEGQVFTHTWLWQKLHWGNSMTFRRYGHIHPEFTHSHIFKLLKKEGFKIRNVAYSEHFFYQVISVFSYFLPLELLDLFFGKKAKEYSDSAVIRKGKRRKRFDVLLLLRNTWLLFIKFLRRITLWELELGKSTPFTAWKVIVLAEKK